MKKAEEIFNIKAEYNKWLKELTNDEKKLVLEMINEAFLQCNVSGRSEQLLEEQCNWLMANTSLEVEKIVDFKEHFK